MPFVVSRSDMPTKMFALIDGDGDASWIPNRQKATPLTEPQAEAFIEEYAKYSDTDLDIEGVKPAAASEQSAAEAA